MTLAYRTNWALLNHLATDAAYFEYSKPCEFSHVRYLSFEIHQVMKQIDLGIVSRAAFPVCGDGTVCFGVLFRALLFLFELQLDLEGSPSII